MEDEKREYYETLRSVYGSLLLNGPFAIIVAHHGEMVAHTDRIRLRPMVAGINGDIVYTSSEESAIRLVSPELDRVWIGLSHLDRPSAYGQFVTILRNNHGF